MKKLILLPLLFYCLFSFAQKSEVRVKQAYKIKTDTLRIITALTSTSTSDSVWVFRNSDSTVRKMAQTDLSGSGGYFSPNQTSTGNTTHDANYNNFLVNNIHLSEYTAGVSGNYAIIHQDSTLISLYALHNATATSSQMDLRPDSIRLLPFQGKLNIDSLRNAPGTKAIRYNPTTGIVSYTDTTISTLGTLSKGITIELPSAAENIGMWKTPVDITVSDVQSVLVGSSSPSVTFNIAFGSNRTSGTNVFSSGQTVTSTTTGLNSNSGFNDQTIPAGSFIWVTTSAQSGTVTQIEITVNFTKD